MTIKLTTGQLEQLQDLLIDFSEEVEDPALRDKIGEVSQAISLELHEWDGGS